MHHLYERADGLTKDVTGAAIDVHEVRFLEQESVEDCLAIRFC
jgi:hypothetical protein